MHTQDLTPWVHDHRFDKGSPAAERSTKAVMWITAAMMVIEIWAGFQFQQAIAVAVLGLIVNVVCAVILKRGHEHGHEHAGQLEDHHHHDLNLRSAYVHVIADAATSVLAIVALSGGMLWGWGWLDPVMGIAGAGLVATWAWGLIRSTANVLLDREMGHPVSAEIREEIEARGKGQDTEISDLHLWRVGKNRFACIVSLVTHDSALTPRAVKDWLSKHDELAHITVEIQLCPGGGHAAT